MKISLSWVFDHIVGSWKKYDVGELVEKFNLTIAEIESFEKVSINSADFTLVQIKSITGDIVVGYSLENKKEYTLSKRTDAVQGQWYIARTDASWATLADFGSGKDGLMPAVQCDESDQSGGWKKNIELEDYVLDVDNKSITHRPDLWGHRGIAREIAALLDLSFVEEDSLLASHEIATHSDTIDRKKEKSFATSIKNVPTCKRFASMYFPKITFESSAIWMAHRLARVDEKPIHFIVDVTNYVMCDISQPMHAFDAAELSSHTVTPRLAKKGETITLLDDQKIELTSDDLVITDGAKPVALAGIMGGKASAVSDKTTSLFLESAIFDATQIRKSALYHKKRTDASARFEKTVDPNQNEKAFLRFLKLFDESGISYDCSEPIVSLGKKAEPQTVTVDHDHIEKAIGTSIEQAFVVTTLEKLGFAVTADGDTYAVVVPTYRQTKDRALPEDVIEEVARFFGYLNIPLTLPAIPLAPSVNNRMKRQRMIMHNLARSAHAREVNNYPFFDESFLQKLQWQPKDTVGVQNPVSQNATQLVTSLMPHLFKNIDDGAPTHDRLRFFEWNKIWQKNKKNIGEQTSLAGIFYDKKQSVDFYEEKKSLTNLFHELDIDVTWHKVTHTDPWWHEYQTAELKVGGQTIGYAGKINQTVLHKVAEGDAFIFELDGSALLTIPQKEKRFIPRSKYPETSFDISMLIPVSVTVDHIVEVVKKSDSSIYDVALVDFYEKKEWGDRRSVTVRLHAKNPEKTLAKDDIDTIYQHVSKVLGKIGAEIR